MRIESNRKVPQTNRLSLGVLDMDVIFEWFGLGRKALLLDLEVFAAWAFPV